MAEQGLDREQSAIGLPRLGVAVDGRNFGYERHFPRSHISRHFVGRSIR